MHCPLYSGITEFCTHGERNRKNCLETGIHPRRGQGGRGAKRRKWSHITVHAAPEFHREYKLYAVENGLLMESFALFKKTRAGQEKRRAG